jgi:hypothetical protein
MQISKMVNYLLLEEDLPSLERVACATELDEEKEMSKSRKISPFEGWAEHFDKEVLEWIITGTKKHWCALGYDRL